MMTGSDRHVDQSCGGGGMSARPAKCALLCAGEQSRFWTQPDRRLQVSSNKGGGKGSADSKPQTVQDLPHKTDVTVGKSLTPEQLEKVVKKG